MGVPKLFRHEGKGLAVMHGETNALHGAARHSTARHGLTALASRAAAVRLSELNTTLAIDDRRTCGGRCAPSGLAVLFYEKNLREGL